MDNLIMDNLIVTQQFSQFILKRLAMVMFLLPINVVRHLSFDVCGN